MDTHRPGSDRKTYSYINSNSSLPEICGIDPLALRVFAGKSTTVIYRARIEES
ncbi:hypothetical protein [Acidithrix ferrooxidans]|uniref:hypothetical protein n=1 Tax=Acidithrix ferrooxidans TaxID=1280514 RepID=UPI001364A9DB|nr:hypothetical protein [Acidithrix ferrooxidans]